MFLRDLAGIALLAGCLIGCRQAEPPVDKELPGDSRGATDPGSTGAGGATSSSDTTATGSGGAGAGMPMTQPASIITWNLESFPLTSSSLEQAAAMISELSPELVAIQEVSEPSAFYDLIDALPGYEGVLNDDDGWLRVGLLYKNARVSLNNVQTLFKDDWYAFPRPPLKAEVQIDGFDFVAVVIHLKAQLNAESEDRRRAGNEALDSWVQEQLLSGDEKDFVLIGDFNDKLLDPPQWNVFGPFLEQPELYSFLTMPAAEAGDHTYIPFESMIDHVLVTNDALDEIAETEVLALEETVTRYRDLTDHRPVRTWLR